ncbi:cysteine desulfurase family protein [Gorillibacterium timonense]|uniref:cysteine desulfurase family protein n=1 Tax=Gorillibacterium timonense TaxID=1689269 RepID=UPI00071D49FA|nr:cysteine desulfurase family protein [Gorillibacterium timonense]
MLYLDYCATTPTRPEVIRTISEVMANHFGNPSSLHRLGLEAEQLVAKARRVVAGTLSCKPQEVIFTGSGSESNNLAIKGAALAYQGRGKHVITSLIEHASVYESYRQLERMGFQVTYLPVDETGQVRPEDVKAALREDTILVSLMYVNNEMGRIQPIAEIGRLLKERPRTLFHVDAIQAFGKLDCTVGHLHVDLLSLSAHKFGGPKGTGVLYRREGVELAPLIAGGGQENGLRSGTENVPLLVGMAKACRLAAEEREATVRQLRTIQRLLLERLAAIPRVSPTTPLQELDGYAPQLVHITVPGIRPEVVVHALEERDIFISTRSACSSGQEEPSRVLLAMGMPRERAVSGLRISYSAAHTEADMERFADELERVLDRIGNGR